MNFTFDSSAVFEVISVLAIVVVFLWRMPSKGDIERLEKRFDKVDERFDKVDERFERTDAKIDDVRKEAKADLARLEDRFNTVDERFDKTDAKIDDTRKEAKADLARLEDRLAASNSYQAQTVEILEAIRRELEERREPL